MRGLSGPPSSGVRQAERAGVEARATGRNLRIHLIDSLPSSAKSHGQDVSKNDESARGKLQKLVVGGDSGHSGVVWSMKTSCVGSGSRLARCTPTASTVLASNTPQHSLRG